MVDLRPDAAGLGGPDLPIGTGSAPLLEVEDLRVVYDTTRWSRSRGDRVVAVDGMDLVLRPGETLGVVGESGSGKSTLARAVVGLVKPTGGRIRFAGEDVTGAKGSRLRELRRHVQMVFQDPYGSVNPRMNVESVIAEPLENYHPDWTRSRRREAVADLLSRVQLAGELATRPITGLSGGQLQRVGIARALALGPQLLVADEPVSALDVSVQAQVLDVFADLKRAEGIAFLFITHNLAVAQHVTDRIAVVYAGRVVETGPSDEITESPQHPYTRALLAAAPSFERRGRRNGDRVLPVARSSGAVGCPYRPRCPLAADVCARETPPLEVTSGWHEVACHAVGGHDRGDGADGSRECEQPTTP